MLPSERIEFAIYKRVDALGPGPVTVSLAVLAEATEEGQPVVVERLEGLFADKRIALFKFVGDARVPYASLKQDKRFFFYTGAFVVEILPQARRYFEQLEEARLNDASRKSNVVAEAQPAHPRQDLASGGGGLTKRMWYETAVVNPIYLVTCGLIIAIGAAIMVPRIVKPTPTLQMEPGQTIGAGGKRQSPAPPVPTEVPSTPGTFAVYIDPGRPWTSTMISVQEGQSVAIEAKGIIRFSDHDPPGGPEGQKVDCYHLTGIRRWTFPAPNLACHSLVGRIGDQGVPFEIGKSVRFRASTSGRLELGVNDNWFPDNSGSWMGEISINNSEPH